MFATNTSAPGFPSESFFFRNPESKKWNGCFTIRIRWVTHKSLPDAGGRERELYHRREESFESFMHPLIAVQNPSRRTSIYVDCAFESRTFLHAQLCMSMSKTSVNVFCQFRRNVVLRAFGLIVFFMLSFRAVLSVKASPVSKAKRRELFPDISHKKIFFFPFLQARVHEHRKVFAVLLLS